MSKFINIIGYGYVGSALGYVCQRNGVDFCVYDVIKKTDTGAIQNFDNLEELVEHSEKFNDFNIYIICVPTPTGESGECDTSIVEHVMSELNRLSTLDTVVLIKSTVKPGTCRRLSDKYASECLNIMYCPEFLKEKTYKEDMYNADFVLLGKSPSYNSLLVEDVFKNIYNHKKIDIVVKKYEECELLKYTINVFLSVKVWFFNEIYTLCDSFGVNYSNMKELFKLEPRLGESHMDVPGHDGKMGFGGKCLPKETRGMSHLQQSVGLDNSVLQQILKRNSELRGPE